MKDLICSQEFSGANVGLLYIVIWLHKGLEVSLPKMEGVWHLRNAYYELGALHGISFSFLF